MSELEKHLASIIQGCQHCLDQEFEKLNKIFKTPDIEPKLDTRLKEIRERVEKATPGPWECDFQSGFGMGGSICSSRNISDFHRKEVVKQPDIKKENIEQCFDNGRFIATSREDVPFLLDQLDKHRHAIHVAKSQLSWHQSNKTLAEIEKILNGG